MGYLLKQSSNARPLLFLMVDSGDHLTGKTGLTPDVEISKNGGAFAAPAGAVSEIGSGWYKVAGNAADTGTLGVLALRATDPGAAADPTDTLFEVVAFDPADAMRLGLGALPNAAAAASGGLPTVGTGAGQVSPSAGAVSVASLSASALAGLFTTNTGSNYAAAVAGSVVKEIAANAVGSGSAADWSSGERAQIRHRLGLDGTATAPTATPALPVQVASVASGAVTHAAFAAGAIDADALAASGVAAIREAIFSQAVDGVTLESLLAALLAATVGVTEVSGNTVAFKRQDGSTTKVTITYGAAAGERSASVVS